MSEEVEPSLEDIRERLSIFYEVVASYQSRLLEASSGYNQVVVLAGYAGFFTIWSAVRDDVPHWLLLISGALMGVSLIIYVAWTVWGMVLKQTHIQRMIEEIAKGPEGYLARVQAAEAKNVAEVAGYSKIWKPVVWSSGLTALAAAILVASGAFAAVVWPRPAATQQVSLASCRTANTSSAPAQPQANSGRTASLSQVH
jgi:hypothetical protein